MARQRLREFHACMCTRANTIAVLACVHENILARHEIGASSTTGGRVDRKQTEDSALPIGGCGQERKIICRNRSHGTCLTVQRHTQ